MRLDLKEIDFKYSLGIDLLKIELKNLNTIR